MSYLWDYEERRSRVTEVEYQSDTVAAVDEFPTTEKNTTEGMVFLQGALTVAPVGMNMSDSLQHF